jgi:DNA-binding response OmpR family regulator
MQNYDPRILVVEDDPNDALLLERAFRKAGIPGFDRVLSDGEQVMAYLGGLGHYSDRRAFPLPSHLILDLKLPKVSGLELLTWIRGSREHRRLPIAILSSSGEQTDQVRARELGVDGYFVKPNRSSDLLAVVLEIALMWNLTRARV